MSGTAERLYAQSQALIAHLSSLLTFIANVHIARHVDIDGIRRDESGDSDNELYNQTVENGRLLIRTLEAAMHSLYEDGSAFFSAIQSTRRPDEGLPRHGGDASVDCLDSFAVSIEANLGVVSQCFEALLSIGHDQADMSQGDYNGSIDWRMSRLSMIDTQFGGAQRPISNFDGYAESIVDMELAFQKPGIRAQPIDSSNVYRNGSLASDIALSSQDTSQTHDTSNGTDASSFGNTLVQLSPVGSFDNSPLFDDDRKFVPRMISRVY